MTIISINKINALHPVQTWHISEIPEGWAIVPEDMVETAFELCGDCDIEVSDGVLTSISKTAERLAKEFVELKENKLNELSAACNTAITYGCDVALSDGSTAHYALAETDQINISTALSSVTQGAQGFPYHADGELCRIYSAADIVAISNAAAAHKLYHTTYFNHLKAWVERLETAEEISVVTYGSDLPEDLVANMNAILSAVGG